MALVFLSFGVSAQERKVMQVGFEDFLPSASIKDGKPIGVDVELIAAAMKEVGVEIKFGMYPWSRCLQMLDDKELDAVIPMVYSKERDEKYSLGTSLRTRGNVIVLSKNVTKDVKGIKDLDGITVGVGQGYAVSKEFDEATHFKRDAITTSGEMYKILLKKAAAGRNDAVVIDLSVVNQMMKKLKIENDVKISNYKFPKASHVGFTKNSPFLPLYEKGFKTIQDNGTYKKTLDKWELQ